MANYPQSQKLLKVKDEELTVEFEVEPLPFSEDEKVAGADLDEISSRIQQAEDKIVKLNTDIDRLTNHADGIDYMVAVASGILCGAIDSFFVGEWDFESAKALSNKQINEKIINFAKKQGYEGERLEDAVDFLEKKYKLPGDIEWNLKKKFVDEAKKKGFAPPPGKKGKYVDAVKFMNEHFPKNDGTKWGVIDNFITESTHHLDDFCHHPTLVGLICCIVVQFTGTSVYVNKDSEIINLPVTVNDYGMLQGHNVVTRFFCGIINWFMSAAKAISNAEGHWMSDLAGSNQSAGKGMGLPGPFMSLLKELSALPLFRSSNFGENLRKAYQNGIGTGKQQLNLKVFNALFEGASSKFDYRTENAVKLELKRQSVPVIINEVIVRAAYFIRRFIMEARAHNSLNEINWKNTLPLNNRTIARMITIASGTFTACDLADAAVRSAVKNAGQVGNPLFWKDFILRVNFVGIGRFAVAVGVDIGMGIKKSNLEYEKIKLMSEQIELRNARMFCYQKGMWLQLARSQKAMEELVLEMEKSCSCFVESYQQIYGDVDKIGSYIPKIREKNPGLIEEMQEILKWG